jgi:hypothetical protein
VALDPAHRPGRARAIVSWLRSQQASLQLTIEADVDSMERDGVPLIAAELENERDFPVPRLRRKPRVGINVPG